jgi:hypothetical protein
MKAVITVKPYGDNEVKIYHVGSNQSCNAFIADYADKLFDEYLEKGIARTQEWLIALKDFTWCTWAYHEIEVYFKQSTYAFDEVEDWELAVEECIDGEYLMNYINNQVPNFRIIPVGG